MKTDLIDLLASTEIIHPTRIVAVEAGHRQLRLTIAGYPWWREQTGQEEERIVLIFEGISEGTIEPETLLDMEWDEALEVFEVSRLSDQEWAHDGTSYAVYCSERLPQPLRLYAVIEDYLWNAGAPRSARDFLNIPGGSLSRFCAVTDTNSYLLAQAPSHIHKMVLAELQNQNVAHNVVTTHWVSDQGLYVKIGGTSFICETATAES